MSQSARPRLLMVPGSDMNIRDFRDCGALDMLASRFDLDFVSGEAALEETLRPYGQVRASARCPLPRFWLWNCASTTENLLKYDGIVRGMDREFFNRKSAGQAYWHWSTRLGEKLYRLGLGRPFVGIARKILDWTVWLSPAPPTTEYAAVLIPTVLRDRPAEDVIRWARRHGVPSIALQGNWDCFNLKQMLASPDHFLVWGEQSWYFARLLQQMPHRSLHVIGSQRLDHYFGALPDKATARRDLGLDPAKRILLFCGVFGPFDEVAALRDLEEAIESGRLPADLEILYKPHPRTPPEKGADAFAANRFRHVKLAGYKGRDVWNTLDEYPRLLRAVDATISPYSTMGLESALCGRPALLLGFHTDPNLPYWRYALEFLHIQSYRFLPWAIRCDRIDEFIPSVHKILAMAADRSMERRAIDSTAHVIYRDERRYAERLYDAILEITGVPRVAETPQLESRAG